MGFEIEWTDPADAAFTWTRWESFPTPFLYDEFMVDVFDSLRTCWFETSSFMARNHIPMHVDGWWYARAATDDPDEAERYERFVRHVHSFEERGTNYYIEELEPELKEIVARLGEHPSIDAPIDELIAHVRECSRAHGHMMWDIHWRVAAMMASRPDAFGWPKAYTSITGRPESEATAFLGGTANETSEVIGELRALARLEPDSDAFRDAFDALLARRGHRVGHGWGSRTVLESPTWNMRPDVPLQMIATYARSDLDAIEKKEREMHAERSELKRTVLGALAEDKRAAFDAALARAIIDEHVTEGHNYWLDQCAPGLLREAVDVLGRRLHGDGAIDDPDDVLHLSLDEIATGAIDRGKIAARRDRYEVQRTYDAPETIGGEPVGRSRPDWIKEGAGLQGDVLSGVGASGGRYTGRARIVEQTVMLPDLDDGDILVAVDAGPSWTPIFAVLGAVVLDTGADFQHAAVMAREFGIPAVLGTKQATSAITDGSVITVDGDAGVVELRAEAQR